MTILEALLVGILSGVTAFLPVSQSSHLALLSNVLRFPNADPSDPFLQISIQIGLIAAVLLGFRRDRRRLASAFKKNNRAASVYLQLLVLAAVPLLVSILLRHLMEQLLSHTVFISLLLFANGLLLYTAEQRSIVRNTSKLTAQKALLIGGGHAAAAVPGLSGSGAAISLGLLTGSNYESAFRFACRLSAVGGCLWLPFRIVDAFSYGEFSPFHLLVCVLTCVFGYLSIRFLRRTLSRSGLCPYAYYCWGFSFVLLVFSLIS